MAYMEKVDATCTNKICDYFGTISKVVGDYDHQTLVGKLPVDIKTVCPKCGFKTLDPNYIEPPTEEEMAELTKALITDHLPPYNEAD